MLIENNYYVNKYINIYIIIINKNIIITNI